MNRYPWLYSHFKQIITSYQSGYGHHALLIHTFPGVGDDALIYAISNFLMCQHPEMYKSCGKCRCCQMILAYTHPDFHVIELMKNKISIGVDLIREMNKKIYERACFGGPKIIWIKDIIQLTNEAANALLKILEEPPPNTWFFLSCYELNKVPMTLRSRCRCYYLNTPNEIIAVRWLAKKIKTSPEARLSALRLCGGAPLTALLQLNPKIWSQRKLLCDKLYEAIKTNNWFNLLTILNNEQILQKLNWLFSLLLDIVKLQHGITLINNVDVLPMLHSLTSYLLDVTIQSIIYDIWKTLKQLLTIPGLNRELLVTNLLLNIEYSRQPDAKLSTVSI